MSTVDKPYVFFLDIKELRQSLKICVKSCPNNFIGSAQDIYKYYKEADSKLCRYDFNMTNLLGPIQDDVKFFHMLGPCPKLPVYAS